MDGIFIDDLVVFFALVYYAFLFIVYLLRAHEFSKLEWKLSILFSVQLVPFASLWVLNLLIDNNSGRLISGLPIIIYLIYDLWYRAITQKKPYHHPDRWPPGLVVYLLLLLIGSIGLNWYGYLISKSYGNMLVIAFFIMMSSFAYYQYRYNKRKKVQERQVDTKYTPNDAPCQQVKPCASVMRFCAHFDLTPIWLFYTTMPKLTPLKN
jgi:hypothetical protein